MAATSFFVPLLFVFLLPSYVSSTSVIYSTLYASSNDVIGCYSGSYQTLAATTTGDAYTGCNNNNYLMKYGNGASTNSIFDSGCNGRLATNGYAPNVLLSSCNGFGTVRYYDLSGSGYTSLSGCSAPYGTYVDDTGAGYVDCSDGLHYWPAPMSGSGSGLIGGSCSARSGITTAGNSVYVSCNGDLTIKKSTNGGTFTTIYTSIYGSMNALAVNPRTGDIFTAATVDSSHRIIYLPGGTGPAQSLYTASACTDIDGLWINSYDDLIVLCNVGSTLAIHENGRGNAQAIDTLENVDAISILTTGNSKLYVLDNDGHLRVYSVSSISGDPTFVGLRNQQYQIHGQPNGYYNLISTPTHRLTARFIYLDSTLARRESPKAIAVARGSEEDTARFTHTGTFLGEVGVQLHCQRLHVVAGAYTEGFSRILLNGNVLYNVDTMEAANYKFPMKISAGSVEQEMNVEILSPFRVRVALGQMNVMLVNSDWFINVAALELGADIVDKVRSFKGNAALLSQSESISSTDGEVSETDSDSESANIAQQTSQRLPLEGLIGRSAYESTSQSILQLIGDVENYRSSSNDLFEAEFINDGFQMKC